MRTHSAVLLILVAISGMSGLMYELLWIRLLGLHFGTSTPAIAMVTGTFMLGLALGNAWLGARADKSARPLRLYSWLELGIATSGYAVSALFLYGGGLLDQLSRWVASSEGSSGLVRGVVFAGLMLVPATLMGGTLPVLSRALLRGSDAGRTVGGIYGWNTAGAVLGALLPDFVVVPSLGVHATAYVAALGNVVVVLGVNALLRQKPDEVPASHTASLEVPEAQSEAQPSHAAPEPSSRLSARHVALVFAAVSGFCGMALQVLWSRTLEHFSAALVTSFAVLLSVYLLALAVGALLSRRFADKAAAPLHWAAAFSSACGIYVLASLWFAPTWRDFQRELWPLREDVRRSGIFHQAIDALLHALYLEALPCLLMGAAFPFLANAAVDTRAAGNSAGRLLTVNTLACVAGSAIVAFVWLPTLGQEQSYLTLASILVLFGALGAFAIPGARNHSWPARALSVMGIGAAVAVVAWLPADHFGKTMFRSGGHVLELREGPATTAAVAVRFEFGEPYRLELLTPGVSMSDTSLAARRYMGMMAHAGALFAGEPKQALLICYGVGNTARSLLSHPTLTRLDVVDIAQEVIDLAPRFAVAQGKDPLTDPRTHVWIDDGRHHLLIRDTRYDVITAEPPPPNHAGVVNLYTREFYELAARRLTERGVITQWLPTFQLSRSDIHAMIAAFTAALPHTALLYGQGEQFILIGSRSPLVLDAERFWARADSASVRRDLRQSGIDGASDIAGSILLADADLRALAKGQPILRDDRPSIQYPFEDVHDAHDYVRLFGGHLDASEALEFRGSEAQRAQVLRIRSSLEHVLRAGSLPLTDPRREAEITRALESWPESEALLELLGLHFERATLARHALQRPSTLPLLRGGN
jgi:spermidine synthase